MPEGVILASASPRRRELLSLLGIPFEVIPSAYDEPSVDEHPHPAEWACHLAREKAFDVAARGTGRVVIGADTVVALGTRVYGKPRDAVDAVRMLGDLAGRVHSVITGVTVVDDRGNRRRSETFATQTAVYFRTLDPREVEVYVASGEPMDKAGAYAIQGSGGLLIDRIEGDYPNVVGLPLTPLALCLRSLGFSVLGLPSPALPLPPFR